MSTQTPQRGNGHRGPGPASEDGLLAEQLVTFAHAARLVPRRRGGRPCAASTIWRWCLKGVRAADGSRVRLEYTRVGHTRMTSREALARFYAALTAADTPPDQGTPEAQQQPPARRRSEDRRRQIQHAEAVCKAAGI